MPCNEPAHPEPPSPAPTAPAPTAPADPPAPQPSIRWLVISIVSFAAVLIIALAVFFIFFYKVSPMISLGKALHTLRAETEERFNSTPLKALVMLTDILEDGTVSLKFDYTGGLFSGWIDVSATGDAKISSNTETRNFAIEAQVDAYGEYIDIDAYMNRERIALRSQLLGNNFYGFKYDTFRDDIRKFKDDVYPFADIIGLDDPTMDMYADVVDEIKDIMNAEGSSEETQKAYAEVLTNFFTNLEMTSRRTTIVQNERRVWCREIAFKITKDDLEKLLKGLNDVYENDETLRKQLEMYNNPILRGIYGDTVCGYYDEFLKDHRKAIRDFEQYYSGDIEILFFVGRNDRLHRLQINSDTEYDGDRSQMKATLDCGNSIYDSWILDLHRVDDSTANDNIVNDNIEYGSISDNALNESTTKIQWDFRVQSDKQFNSISITSSDVEPIYLNSEWDQNNGSFRIAYATGSGQNELTGYFIPDDKNFLLTLDNVFPANSHQSLAIEVSTETGTRIDEIEYINLDKWGESILQSLIQLFMSRMF